MHIMYAYLAIYFILPTYFHAKYFQPCFQTAAALDTEKKMKDRKKKKRKHNIHKVHEDECYRCGEGGELVMCDKSNCPKVYHLKCLKLAKLPHGENRSRFLVHYETWHHVHDL